jgi:hypothetical protein
MMWIIGGGEPAFVVVFVVVAFRSSIWILETSVDTTNVNKNTDANGSNFDLSKVGAINDKANTQLVSNKGVLMAVRYSGTNTLNPVGKIVSTRIDIQLA